jgi:hypothetical protein
MSLIASFYLIEKAKLDLLQSNSLIEVKKGLFTKKIVDNYYPFLEANSVELPTLDYNGYNGSVFLDALDYLEDRHSLKLIDKTFDELSNEIGKNRSLDVHVLSYDFKVAMQGKLNLESFTEDDIQKYIEEIGGDVDLDSAIACKKAIEVLSKNIDAIPNQSYVLICELGQ